MLATDLTGGIILLPLSFFFVSKLKGCYWLTLVHFQLVLPLVKLVMKEHFKIDVSDFSKYVYLLTDEIRADLMSKC